MLTKPVPAILVVVVLLIVRAIRGGPSGSALLDQGRALQRDIADRV